MVNTKNENNGGLGINLDPIFNSRIRLAIISILCNKESCSFKEIVTKTTATAGNVSVQIKKLEKGGYIVVQKEFNGNYPSTICLITKIGIDAFRKYKEDIIRLIDFGNLISPKVVNKEH